MADSIDLAGFCGHDTLEVRSWMHKPWRHAGKIIATNGHLLIALDDDGRDGVAEYESGRHPNVTNLLANTYTTAPVPLPDLGPVLDPCDRCGGSGFHFVAKCDECEGGRFDHGSHSYKCAACDGEGSIGSETEPTRCAACEGFGETGRFPLADYTSIGEAMFQTRYLRRFAGLPNVTIVTGQADQKAILKFDGGMGVVMPTRTK